MGKVFEGIDSKLAAWIAAQPLFFVGTAPQSGGHVNVSPKGPIESLAVLGPRTIAYLDLIGSGAETAAHLRDNGNVTRGSPRSGAKAATRCRRTWPHGTPRASMGCRRLALTGLDTLARF